MWQRHKMPILDLTESSSNVMCVIWNFQMAQTCVDIKWDTQGLNHMSVAFARKDFLEKIIWRNISRPTLRACRIIAQYATEDSSAKLPCAHTSRTNTLDSMTSLKLAHYVVIVRLLWKVSGFTSLTGDIYFFTYSIIRLNNRDVLVSRIVLGHDWLV